MLVAAWAWRQTSNPCKIKQNGRKRSANVVMNFPGNGGTLLFDGALQMFRQFRQPLLRMGEIPNGLLSGHAGFVDFSRPLNHMG